MDPPLLAASVQENKQGCAPKSGWEIFGADTCNDPANLPNEKAHPVNPAEGGAGADSKTKSEYEFDIAQEINGYK